MRFHVTEKKKKKKNMKYAVVAPEFFFFFLLTYFFAGIEANAHLVWWGPKFEMGANSPFHAASGYLTFPSLPSYFV